MINYVYITSGSKAHLKEAELSAKSIKQKQIQSHVTIYTDIEPTNQECFDKIIPIEPSKTTKEAKTKRIQHLIEHKEEQYVHLDTGVVSTQLSGNRELEWVLLSNKVYILCHLHNTYQLT